MKDKKCTTFANVKRNELLTRVQVLTTKTIKIMDCVFRITEMVKKIGFVIILAELAVIAYMNF